MVEGWGGQSVQGGEGAGRLGGRGLLVHLRVSRDHIVLLLQALPVGLAGTLSHLLDKGKRRMVADVDLVEEGVGFVLLWQR